MWILMECPPDAKPRVVSRAPMNYFEAGEAIRNIAQHVPNHHVEMWPYSRSLRQRIERAMAIKEAAAAARECPECTGRGAGKCPECGRNGPEPEPPLKKSKLLHRVWLMMLDAMKAKAKGGGS